MVEIGGRCLLPSPGCGGGKVRVDGKCVCPEGTRERRGRCLGRATPAQKIEQMHPDLRPVRPTKPLRPVQFCTRGKVLVDGRCVCPQRTIELRGRCVPRLTPPPRPSPPSRPVQPQFTRPTARPSSPQPPAQQLQQMRPELLPVRPPPR